MYSWGEGGHGQLGHGDTERQLLPRRIEALEGERVVRVDANRWGLGVSAVTTSEGAVLIFGQGRNGALGLEDEEDHSLPTRVTALPTGRAVVDLALGGDPDNREAWSVVMMRGGGAGESLHRWGNLFALNGESWAEAEIPSAVEAWAF